MLTQARGLRSVFWGQIVKSRNKDYLEELVLISVGFL